MRKHKNALRELIRLKGISMAGLAESIGLSRQSLYNRLKDPSSFRVSEISALERELSIVFNEFV